MAKSTLTTAQVVEMLNLMADRIIEAEPMLSEADRNLGDGDHGLGMKRGMEAVKEKLAGGVESIEKAFSNTGMAMMSSMGGASGAIFGTFWRSGAKAITGCEAFDAQALASLVKAGVEGVMTRGGAKPAAAAAPAEPKAEKPKPAPAAAKPAAADGKIRPVDKSNMTIEQMIAYCREHDANRAA